MKVKQTISLIISIGLCVGFVFYFPAIVYVHVCLLIKYHILTNCVTAFDLTA